MQEKKRIALVCANKLRSLDGLVYLKIELEKKDHTIKIFNFGGHTNFIKMEKFLPHVLVIPTILEKTMREFSKSLKKCGSKIIELKGEGIFNELNEKHNANAYEDCSFLDAEIVWGETLKKLLLEYSNIPKEKVFVCGCPRFDIYSNKNLSLSKADFCQKYNLNKKNKIISYATGFCGADSTQKEIKNSYNKANLDLHKISKMRQNLRANGFSSIIKLAKEFSNINFIIKVHPFELIDFYIKNKPKNLSNLVILKNEKINNIINVTDIFIHSNSITSVESWFKNLPTICLYLGGDKKTLSRFVKGGDFVENYEDLREKITYYLDGNSITKEKLSFRKKFIKEDLYKIDGKAAERIAVVMDNIAKTAPLKLKKLNMPFFLNFSKFKYLLRKIFRIPDDRSLLFLKKHKGYYSMAVRNRDILEREKYFRERV